MLPSNEQVEETINVIGAVVEILKVFNDELDDKSFSPSERIYLCGIMLKNLINPKGGGDA